MNTTTKAQRINKRQDAIWEKCEKLSDSQNTHHGQAQHSPLPWKFDGYRIMAGPFDEGSRMDWTGTYVQIASVTLNTEHTPKPIMEANAAFIVRAVNSFEPLLEAARKVEARSHYDADENAYHVDAEAMDKLCEIIGKAKR